VNRIFILGMIFAAVSVAGAWSVNKSGEKHSAPWDSNAITATYVGAQLRETSASDTALFLAYELQNNTNKDYRLSDGPGAVVMSRVKPDGSLSSQEPIQLSYATFLPAHQRARIALQIRGPFRWPADNDPVLSKELVDFVTQKLSEVDGFALFDEADRCEIDFPSGWRNLGSGSKPATN
jgi:hypothetical protein